MRNCALAFALTVCAFATSSSLADEGSIRLKEGIGRDVTMARCAVCHSLDYITMVAPAMNRAAWEKSVRKMIDVFGAPVSEQDASSIVEYLGQHYSASSASAMSRSARLLPSATEPRSSRCGWFGVRGVVLFLRREFAFECDRFVHGANIAARAFRRAL